MAEQPRQNQQDDEFARESFTFRRMTKWQLWSMTIAAILVLILLLTFYGS